MGSDHWVYNPKTNSRKVSFPPSAALMRSTMYESFTVIFWIRIPLTVTLLKRNVKEACWLKMSHLSMTGRYAPYTCSSQEGLTVPDSHHIFKHLYTVKVCTDLTQTPHGPCHADGGVSLAKHPSLQKCTEMPALLRRLKEVNHPGPLTMKHDKNIQRPLCDTHLHFKEFFPQDVPSIYFLHNVAFVGEAIRRM